MLERNLGYTALITNTGSETTTSSGHIAMAAPAGSTSSGSEGMQADAEGMAQRALGREDGRDWLAKDDGDVEAQRATEVVRQKSAPSTTVFRCPECKQHLFESRPNIGRRLMQLLLKCSCYKYTPTCALVLRPWSNNRYFACSAHLCKVTRISFRETAEA